MRKSRERADKEINQMNILLDEKNHILKNADLQNSTLK